jgi:beta-N-acetylhexosaminidase
MIKDVCRIGSCKRTVLGAVMSLTALLFFCECPDACADDRAGRHTSQLTLRQKVGQLLLLGFQGKQLDAKDRAHIRKLGPGGIVFYRRNFADASGIAPLISNIKALLRNDALPTFFAVDQEGWIVHRVGGELFTPPSAPSIGALGSEELARETGLAVGSALRRLGININLAPVLDVPADIIASPMIPRCFSNDPGTVEALGTSYISGLKAAGLLATAKHFPGIGRAREDTHHKLPHVRWENASERDNDILPFRGAIEAGVDLIMAGHVIAEPGDAVDPVSLSSYWMREVLRRELGFDGLIVVDNIEMKAIEDMVSVPRAAVKAFKAGADIIMVSHERKNQREVFEALLRAVRTGEISTERLDDSVRRIADAKKKILSRSGREPEKTLPVLSKQVAENTVSDVRLKDVPYGDMSRRNRVLYVGGNRGMIEAAKASFSYAGTLDVPLSQYKKMNPEIPLEELIGGFDGVIIDASYPDVADILSLCTEHNVKYVVLLSSYPAYALRIIARLRPKRMVIILENSPPHLHAAVEVISGIRQAKGTLPYKIRLPEDYTYTQ